MIMIDYQTCLYVEGNSQDMPLDSYTNTNFTSYIRESVTIEGNTDSLSTQAKDGFRCMIVLTWIRKR